MLIQKRERTNRNQKQKELCRVLLLAIAFLLLLQVLTGCTGKGDGDVTPGETEDTHPVTSPTETQEPMQPIDISPDMTEYRFAVGGSAVTVDLSTGLVKHLSTARGALACSGVLVDVGISGSYASESLTYRGYDGLSSQALPGISPKPDIALKTSDFALFSTSDSLYVERAEGSAKVLYHYRLTDTGISLDVQVSSHSDNKQLLINGVAFSVLGMEFPNGTTYEYPGNMPYGVFDMNYRRPNVPNETMFLNSVTHFTNGSTHWNICFNDPLEKWSTGVWRDSAGKGNICNLAAVECRIADTDVISVGTLYFRFPGEAPYADVQAWYAELGYAADNETPATGPIYCGHPAGTSDTNYILGEDLAAYANRLQGLRDMGFETVWTMPLNVHAGHEDLYAPTDLSKLDDRYGGKEQAKIFVEQAHSLGMKVIFDFVPHGLPRESLLEGQEEWVCQGRAGNQLVEWECLAFDYSNNSYQEYIRALVKEWAGELGVDGVRFDSAQGSRSNWNRTDGLRPSASTLQGGLSMTHAVIEGFAEAGKNAVVLPEMFSPIPNFTEYTDLYYNNALYRVLMELNANYSYDRTVYTQKLMQFLSVQHQTKVPGQVMANWLQNHDTVCWSGDVKRAEELYGSEWVRNMFRMISWIDGVPVIYMGDENAAEYGVGTSDLTQFFTDTFALRKQYLPVDAETEYLFSDQPVFAFYRGSAAEGERCLILLNFSDTAQSFALPQNSSVIFAENAACGGTNAQLQGYGCLVLKVSGSVA